MRNTVLVLTNSVDGIHSDIVIDKLEALGVNIFRCDVDRLAKGDLAVNFAVNQDTFGFEMFTEDKKLLSTDIKSVWYRRPNRLDSPIADIVQRKYAEIETNQFLEGLWSATIGGVFWLSNPVHLEQARKKVLQLKIARELGFTVPRTIITNDPEQVRQFLEFCGGRIIFKAIHNEMLDYEDKSFNIPTTLIGSEHLAKLELVKKMPSLFQEFIDKKYELRVTVVGDKSFPIMIDSQAHSETSVDWRNPDFIEKLKYTPVSLSQEIIDRCHAMLRTLGLEFGAFDFAVDKHGVCYFLEVNPNGQWYWLEHLTGVLISDAIVAILAKGLTKEGKSY